MNTEFRKGFHGPKQVNKSAINFRELRIGDKIWTQKNRKEPQVVRHEFYIAYYGQTLTVVRRINPPNCTCGCLSPASNDALSFWVEGGMATWQAGRGDIGAELNAFAVALAAEFDQGNVVAIAAVDWGAAGGEG